MRVPLFRGEWYLCDGTDDPDFEYEEFLGDCARAQQWLCQFSGNPFVVGTLRRLFEGSSRYDDAEVLRQVASRLARGTWRAHRPVRVVGSPGSGVVEDSVAFPLGARSVSAPPPPPSMADPPLFPDDIDAAAIADSQKQAAKLGIPFCEECARALLARL